jgi:hypothetical protein
MASCTAAGLRIRQAISLALLAVLFNSLLFWAKEPKQLLPKLVALLPGTLITLMLLAKPVTALMTFHYVQRWGQAGRAGAC